MTTYIYNSTDTPRIINYVSPDSPICLESTIIVPLALSIKAVRVLLNVTYPLDEALSVYIRHPDITYVRLHETFGTSGYINTVFDDIAATSITNGSYPYTGHYRPEEPLTILNGKSAAGTWMLEICDFTSSNVGTLQGWSLEIDVADPPPDPPPDPPICLVGNYAVLTNSAHAVFVGLACGQTLTAGALTRNDAVATLDNIDTDCRRT